MTLIQYTFDGGTDGAGATGAVSTGFSTGSGDAFNTITIGTPANGTFNYDTTGAYVSLGGRWQITAATTWRAYHQWSAVSQVAGRVVFTFNTSVPAVSLILGGLIGSSTFAGAFKFGINASSKGIVQNAAGSTVATTAAALSAGTHYVMEFQVAPGTTTGNGTIQAQLYTTASGTLLINYSNAADNAGGATNPNISRGQLGDNASLSSLDVTFDALAYSTGTLTAIGPPSLSPAAALAASTGVPPSDTEGALSIGMTIRGS